MPCRVGPTPNAHVGLEALHDRGANLDLLVPRVGPVPAPQGCDGQCGTLAGEEVDEGEPRVLVLAPHPRQEEEVVGGGSTMVDKRAWSEHALCSV